MMLCLPKVSIGQIKIQTNDICNTKEDLLILIIRVKTACTQSKPQTPHANNRETGQHIQNST